MNRTQRIRRSCLWAAYGDALGFMTELASPAILKKRTGESRVQGLKPWTRRIGGQFGTDVQLPRGCYSDDTQLRLATGRSIRGNGDFDVDAFARIELPVWNAYSLGAGLASKAAADSLTKPGNQWCNNFYRSKTTSYINAGGNGAAMRIQPHVWSARPEADDTLVLSDIVRNAITTHGHARGILGAAFHGLCVRYILDNKAIPLPLDWHALLESLKEVIQIVEADREISTMWLPIWQREAKRSFSEAVNETLNEMRIDVTLATKQFSVAKLNREDSYRDLLETMGGLDRKNVGSGTKTSILASYAASIFQDDAIGAMRTVANVLHSDTDSIATMAGAMLGPLAEGDPPERVCDFEYLEIEAARLAAIGEGKIERSFDYPDLLYWHPPKRQIDVVGLKDGKWVIAGLGVAKPIADAADARNDNWKWFELHFGQQILLKHRERPDAMPKESLPLFVNRDTGATKPDLKRGPDAQAFNGGSKSKSPHSGGHSLSVNDAVDDVIRSGFDAKVIGAWLVRFSDGADGVDRAIGFAAIVAKARNARTMRDGAKNS